MAKKRLRVTDKFTFRQTPYEGKMAALFIRVSSDEYHKNAKGKLERKTSVNVQISEAEREAKKYGDGSFKIYDDDCDISGSEELANRPSLQALIADIKAGKVHTIITRDQSRIYRNEQAWMNFVYDVCYKFGVDVRGILVPIEIKTSDGRMIAGLTANRDQQRIIEDALRSMKSKNANAKEGKHRQTPPFGYGIREEDGIRTGYVKPKEAEVIKELFKRFANGEGTRSITHWFCINVRKIHLRSIFRWIRNPTYKGALIYNGEECPSAYPDIVSPELWEKANRNISNRAGKYISRKSAINSHLLTGILKCKYCCEAKEAGQKTSHHIYENYSIANNQGTSKTRYIIYMCQTKSKHRKEACPHSVNFRASMIEGFVRDAIGELASYISGHNVQKNTRHEELRLEIEAETIERNTAREALQKHIKRHAIGKLGDEEYDTIKEINVKETQRLEARIAELTHELEAISPETFKQSLTTLSAWDNLSIERQKSGLHQVFDRIMISKDWIEIYLTVYPYESHPDMCLALPLSHDRKKGYYLAPMSDEDKSAIGMMITGVMPAIPAEWN